MQDKDTLGLPPELFYTTDRRSIEHFFPKGIATKLKAGGAGTFGDLVRMAREGQLNQISGIGPDTAGDIADIIGGELARLETERTGKDKYVGS